MPPVSVLLMTTFVAPAWSSRPSCCCSGCGRLFRPEGGPIAPIGQAAAARFYLRQVVPGTKRQAGETPAERGEEPMSMSLVRWSVRDSRARDGRHVPGILAVWRGAHDV